MNTVAYIILSIVAYLMPDSCTNTDEMDDETLACYIAHRDMMLEGWL